MGGKKELFVPTPAVVEKALESALQAMVGKRTLSDVMSDLRDKYTYITRDVDASHIYDFYKKMATMGEEQRHHHKKRRVTDGHGRDTFLRPIQRQGQYCLKSCGCFLQSTINYWVKLKILMDGHAGPYI